MERHPVQSSNIAALAWESETLYVTFHHGGEYAYDGVPYEVFTQMVNAPSVGKFFHAEVKSKFPFRKLETA